MTRMAVRAFCRIPSPSRIRDMITERAARHRLPEIYVSFRYYVTAGGLMSHGADAVDAFRLADVDNSSERVSRRGSHRYEDRRRFHHRCERIYRVGSVQGRGPIP